MSGLCKKKYLTKPVTERKKKGNLFHACVGRIKKFHLGIFYTRRTYHARVAAGTEGIGRNWTDR